MLNLTTLRRKFATFFSEAFDEQLAQKIAEPSTYCTGMLEWQRRLFSAGYGAPLWPIEYGGLAWGAQEYFAWETERARHKAPAHHVMGVSMIGPIIIAFGTEAQKAEHLKPILDGTRLWCQGYSEPGHGSDLASLATRATREGDEYVINGTKVWSSGAVEADWMFALVRTDPTRPRHKGLSLVLIDMRNAGIAVSPIKLIDGIDHLNQIELADVRTPLTNRIGEENAGWHYANALLGHERLSIIPVHSLLAQWEELQTEIGKMENLLDPRTSGFLALTMASLLTDIVAMEAFLYEALAGRAVSVAPSILKLKASEVAQALEVIRVKLAGSYAAAVDNNNLSPAITQGDFARKTYLFGFAHTLYGGSSEIQKNIIAKRFLGLDGRT